MNRRKKPPPRPETPHVWCEAMDGECCHRCGYPFDRGDPVRRQDETAPPYCSSTCLDRDRDDGKLAPSFKLANELPKEKRRELFDLRMRPGNAIHRP